jgi:hypothetical protein
MELLAFFVMLALILDGWRMEGRPAFVLALCVLLPASMFAGKSAFLNTWTGDPVSDRLYASLPAQMGPVHLTFPPADWLVIVGVADRMKHEHRPFCVDAVWAFTFGRDNVCPAMDGLSNLILTRRPVGCLSACTGLYKDADFNFVLMTYPAFKLPFAVKSNNIYTLNTNFFSDNEKGAWSSRRSTIFFRLAPDFTDAPQIRVRVLGKAAAGRPAQIFLNGQLLGVISSQEAAHDFVVDRSALLAGSDNQLIIQVGKRRHLDFEGHDYGFLWMGLELSPASS